MGNLGMQELFIIIAVIAVSGVVFNVVPYWFIFKKAGYHPALSLFMIIPLADVFMKFFLAFAVWPSLKKVGG
jgi:hypothetical protein